MCFCGPAVTLYCTVVDPCPYCIIGVAHFSSGMSAHQHRDTPDFTVLYGRKIRLMLLPAEITCLLNEITLGMLQPET